LAKHFIEVQHAGIWKRMTMSHRASGGRNTERVAQMAQASVDALGFRCDPVPDQRDPRQNNRAASARRRFWATPIWRSRTRSFRIPTYDAIKASSRDERTQYESFVSYFLYACEETINAFATSANGKPPAITI